MDAKIYPLVRRNIQKLFKTAFESAMPGVKIFYESSSFDPSKQQEYVQIFVSGPAMQASHAGSRSGTLDAEVVCVVHGSNQPYRADEISGAVSSALSRKTIALTDFDADPQVHYKSGYIRINDPDFNRLNLAKGHSAGGEKTEITQVNVSFTGTLTYLEE